MIDGAPGEPLTPAAGWGVVHLLLRARRGADRRALGIACQEMVSAIDEFRALEPQQVLTFSVLGAGADLGVMALGPDLDALDRLTKRLLAGPVDPVASFFSLTEASEYMATEEDERARLSEAGEEDVEAALATWRERIATYRDARLHPRLPARRMIAFYPMSKRRAPGANWYELPFAERRRLMLGHGAVGRRYAGRVLQLITGASGLDDWEWGVTLLADEPAVIKEIVYEMRFDPVSATYGEFGPFWVGLVLEPAAALRRAGLT